MAFCFVSFFSACSVDCGCMQRGAESGVSVSLVAGDGGVKGKSFRFGLQDDAGVLIFDLLWEGDVQFCSAWYHCTQGII